LLDVAVALPTYASALERRLLSLPDEFIIKDGDQWLISPQLDTLRPTDLLHTLLRSMGLAVERHPSLYSARVRGARMGLLLAVRRSEVRFSIPIALLHGTVTEAHVALQLTVLDVSTGRPLWTGPLEAKVRITPTIQLTFGSAGLISTLRGPVALAESMATTPASEGTVQSARALLAQAYYQVAVQLVNVLNTAVRSIEP
jgi:hypothetical protein